MQLFPDPPSYSWGTSPIDCGCTSSCIQLCFWGNPSHSFSSSLLSSPIPTGLPLFPLLLSSLDVYFPPSSTLETVCPRPTECEESEIPSAHSSREALVSVSSHHQGRGEWQGQERGKERRDAGSFCYQTKRVRSPTCIKAQMSTRMFCKESSGLSVKEMVPSLES